MEVIENKFRLPKHNARVKLINMRTTQIIAKAAKRHPSAIVVGLGEGQTSHGWHAASYEGGDVYLLTDKRFVELPHGGSPPKFINFLKVDNLDGETYPSERLVKKLADTLDSSHFLADFGLTNGRFWLGRVFAYFGASYDFNQPWFELHKIEAKWKRVVWLISICNRLSSPYSIYRWAVDGVKSFLLDF